MDTTRQGRRARRSALAALTTGVVALAAASGAGAAPTDFDTGFGIGGRVFAGFPDKADYGYVVAVQPDGRILVAGSTFLNYDALVARFNTDGTPDRSFDGDGVKVLDAGEIEMINDLAVQPDGKIVLAGSTTKDLDAVLWRLTPEGTPDGTFDQDGARVIASQGQEYLNAVAIQPDGKIVAAGSSNFAANNDGVVYRLTDTGQPDTTFDQDGGKVVDFGANEYLNGLALQQDGRIVAVGRTSAGNDASAYRLTGTGQPDTTFDGDGAREINLGGDDVAWDVEVQPDGRIVLGGSGGGTPGKEDAAFARLTTGGQLDPSFGTGGLTTVDSGGEEDAWELLRQPDGRILAGGATSNGLDGLLVRLRTDGTPDPAFAAGGKVALGTDGLRDIFGLALQPDGRLLLTGEVEGAQIDLPLFRLQGLFQPPGTGTADQGGGQGGQSGGPAVTGDDGGSRAAASCSGRRATIVGTRRRDVLRGTPGRDVIAALAGDDVIRSLGGNDVVCGGAGDDRLLGGAGRDLLLGNAGRDRLIGGPGLDRLLGGAGRDLRRQ
jgi:uncharacterized delta-60 repeat protein